MNTLTDLQKEASTVVRKSLGEMRRKFSESVCGQKEKYVLFQTGALSIYLYITGEGNIQLADRNGKILEDQRYELADFDDDLEALLNSLVENLQKLIEQDPI